MKIASLLATALIAFSALSVEAQTYPSRPIRVIVPQPPGGGFDLVARTIAEPLARLLGNPVVVENRPGAGMLVGTEAAAKAEADGYTILLGAKPNLAFNAGLYDKLPYDPRADFVPVGLATFNPYTLVARNDLPFNSLKEILAYARANPGKLTYASAGNGTGQHISAAVTFHRAGVQLTHVPYKGAGPAYQDLMPGRVDLFFDNAATAAPASGPMQSFTNLHGRSRSASIRAAHGRSENSASFAGSPLGRPRWLITIARPPCSMTWRSVGRN